MDTERKYKYYSKFTSVAKCLVDPEVGGKSLSLASISDLKAILPPDIDKNPDLLPIAANACVVNLGNDNGDIVDTPLGLKIYKRFANKFIDLEHDRTKIVGHISNAVLSKFNSNYKLGVGSEIVSEDGIKGFEPFNISIAGYIYRYAAGNVVKKLLESNNPESPLYLGVAVSWELGFDEFVLMAGSKERGDDVEIISDPDKIQSYASYLKIWTDENDEVQNGPGKLPDGRPLFRLITEAKLENGEIDNSSVIPIGVGLTFSPAGAVAGVVTPAFQTLASTQIKEKDENNTEIISLSSNLDVTNNIQNPMPLKTLKNIEDLKTLNDENVKEYSFANIQNVIEAGLGHSLQDEIIKLSNEHQTALQAKTQAEAKAKEEAQAAIEKATKLEEDLKATNERLAELQKTQAEALASQKFNERMSFFDEKYELTDKHRAALAARIKNLSDEDFKSYAENEFALFAAPLSKEAVAAQAAAVVTPAVPANQVVASTTPDKEVAAAALANTQPVVEGSVPNTVDPSQTLKDKYANAFGFNKGVVFETIKRN